MMELPGFGSGDVLNIDVGDFPSNFNSELEESVDLMQRVDGMIEEEVIDVETVHALEERDDHISRHEISLDMGNYTIEHVTDPGQQAGAAPPIQLLESAGPAVQTATDPDKLEIGIVASDVTSLLEQFEESEATLSEKQPPAKKKPVNVERQSKQLVRPKKIKMNLDPVEIAKKITPAKRKSAILLETDCLPLKRNRLKHSSIHRVQETVSKPVRSLPSSRNASPSRVCEEPNQEAGLEYLSLEHDYCVNWENHNLLIKSALPQQTKISDKLTLEQRREVYRKKYKVRKKNGSNCSTPQSLSPMNSAPASPSAAKELDQGKKSEISSANKEPLFDKIPDYFAGKLLMGMYKEREPADTGSKPADDKGNEDRTKEREVATNENATKKPVWKKSKQKSHRKSRAQYRKRSSRSPSCNSNSSGHSSKSSSRSRSRSSSRSRSRSRSISRSQSRSRSKSFDSQRSGRSGSRSPRSRSGHRSRSYRLNLSRSRSYSGGRSRSKSRSRSLSRERYSRERSHSHSVSRERSLSRSPSPSRRHRSRSVRGRRRHGSYSSKSRSRSRSPSRSRSRSRSRLRSRSRSRSRRSSYQRRMRDRSRERWLRKEEEEEEKLQEWEDRRVIYVGNIPVDTTKEELYKRFSLFGEIKKITLHFREDDMEGDHYAFITFEYTCDAFACIKAGNAPDGPQYDLCFGGRRNFCKTMYQDLDSMNQEEVKHEYGYERPSSPAQEDDFDKLLQQAMKNIKR